MKLSFDQIKGITAGAVRIWEENDCIRFAKFTQKQTDAWYALDTVLGERAESSTGIRLDFYTNSSFFAFTVAKGKFYDIYVNGILSYLVTPESLSDGRFSISLNTSKGENRVTLVLPSHEPGALYSVELDDGATLTPHALGKKILFIGDSITQGWEAKYNSLCYAQRVARFFNADSLIQAVGGGFFDESILDEELDFDPEIVIVALGTNDWSRGDRATLSGKMNAFFNKLIKQYGDKKIFSITPIWRANYNEIRNGMTFEDIIALVREQATSHGVTVIDGIPMVPHIPEFFSDGYLHPNDLGFGIYAENLIRVLKDYI